MLCKDKIISIFCLIDDILQGINHVEDVKRQVNDSEIIMAAIVSSTRFYDNHNLAIKFMKQYGFIPNMLDKSRLNRRLHKVGKLLYELFELVSSYFKDLCCGLQDYNISSQNQQQTTKHPRFWIDMSKLFELYVFQQLKHKYPENGELQYHKKFNKQEPDFILNTKNGIKAVVDAKY
jgi:hypothetical protein